MQLWLEVPYCTGLDNSGKSTKLPAVSKACAVVVLGMGGANRTEGGWRHGTGVLKLGSAGLGGCIRCRFMGT